MIEIALAAFGSGALIFGGLAHYLRPRPEPVGYTWVTREEWDTVGWLIESMRKGDSIGRRIREDRLELQGRIADLERENVNLRRYRSVCSKVY